MPQAVEPSSDALQDAVARSWIRSRGAGSQSRYCSTACGTPSSGLTHVPQRPLPYVCIYLNQLHMRPWTLRWVDRFVKLLLPWFPLLLLFFFRNFVVVVVVEEMAWFPLQLPSTFILMTLSP